MEAFQSMGVPLNHLFLDGIFHEINSLFGGTPMTKLGTTNWAEDSEAAQAVEILKADGDQLENTYPLVN